MRIRTPDREELLLFGGLREKDELFAAVSAVHDERGKGGTLAYGFIRKIPELVFQPNPQASKRERGEALKASIAEMRKVLSGKFSEALLFAESLEFAEILCAHFDGVQVDAFPVALEVK